MNIYVTKRDGEKVPFDISKIKKSIAYATKDLAVNPLELESKFDQFLKSGIKTRDIHNNVMQHANQLADANNPEWIIVAGRLLAMDMWAEYPLRDKSFLEIIKYNIKKGLYAKELTQFYTEEDILTLAKSIDYDKDLKHSYASLKTAQKKYLNKFELNQLMHMVNAMRFGQFEPAETRLVFVKETYLALANREISLATPFLSNLRKGGNVSSCFIIAIEDDLDSIMENLRRAAEISKNGGGLGVYLGKLRAKGSEVGGNENAAGTIVNWCKLFNDVAVAVNQSFIGETEVVTEGGYKPIKDLTPQDIVLTHDGSYQPIEEIYSHQNPDPIFRIETSEGDTFVTACHPIAVVAQHIPEDMTDEELETAIKNGEVLWKWKDASDLEEGDIIISIQS